MMARKRPKLGPFARKVRWISWIAAIVLGITAGILVEVSFGRGWGVLAAVCALAWVPGIIGLATRRRRLEEARGLG